MIKGGYILQPRCIQEGSMAHNPPVDRELWQYFLRSVNYYKHDLMPRGSGFFRLEDIQEDLSWKVGFRKMKYLGFLVFYMALLKYTSTVVAN